MTTATEERACIEILVEGRPVRVRDAWWHCRFCGDHEPAEEPYGLGDKEPCITCGQGTAVVMTTKAAAKFESEVAQGLRERERSYSP